MSASYLLDTCTIIGFIERRAPKLENRLATLAPDRLYLSALVLAELFAGAAKSRNPVQATAKLTEVTHAFPVLTFDANAAMAYGTIRAQLEAKGHVIGGMDLLIAAQAIANDLVLVTDNLAEFKRVPKLHVQNWLR